MQDIDFDTLIWYCDLIEAAYNGQLTLPGANGYANPLMPIRVREKVLLWQETKPFGFALFNPQKGYLLTLRGTDSLLDAIKDAEATPCDLIPNGGMVECGFASVFTGLEIFDGTDWVSLEAWMAGIGDPIRIIGHSLGAAESTIATLFHENQAGDRSAVTFACPFVGDSAFIQYANRKALPLLHVINSRDLVPMAPLGYERPGNALVFDSEALLPESAKVAFDAKPLFWHSLSTYRTALVALKARPQPF